jgi:hypothetical protein
MSACVGSISQLVAQGHLNKYLNTKPQITFFRFQSMRHTMFALENISIDFEGGSGHIGAGQHSSVRLSRSGDLVYHMYAVIDLPGIANVTTTTVDAATYNGLSATAASYAEAVADVTEAGLYRANGDQKGFAAPESDLTYTNKSGAQESGKGVPYWTNAVGQYLVKEATLFIGSQPIDTLYGDYMFIYEELQGKPGRRLGEMIGKQHTVQLAQARSKFFRRLYVPLPFHFTKSSGCALPLVSLQFHDVRLKITWNGVADAICYGSGLNGGTVSLADGKTFRTVVRPGQSSMSDSSAALSRWGEGTNYNTYLPEAISDSAVSASLEATYVYLDVTERAKFAEGSFEMIMDEVQTLATVPDQKQQSIAVNLSFNHAVMELYWVARQKINEEKHNYFDFGGIKEPLTGITLDPIRTVSLRLNNQHRFQEREGRWFRLVSPWQAHTNIPDSFVYSYSFALNPEDAQPSGSCNFSRIDNATLHLDCDPYMFTDNTVHGGENLSNTTAPDTGATPPAVASGNSVSIVCFARNWNVLRVTLGLAGKAFAN